MGEHGAWNDWTFIALVIVPTAISSVFAVYAASIGNPAISTKFKCFIVFYFVMESTFASFVLMLVNDDDAYHWWQWVQHLVLLGLLWTEHEALRMKNKHIRFMKMKCE